MKTLAEALEVDAELVLEHFDLPISFHRCLVPITGGVMTALMLSHALWITQTLPTEAKGWFACSGDQWTEYTGLSRWEQESARRTLRRLGFLLECRKGMPARIWSRVEPSIIFEALSSHAAITVHG